MTEPIISHCTYLKADHWGMAAKSCLNALKAGQDSMAILYVGPGLAGDLPSILTFLRAARPQTQWQAATVPGVFCRDWFSDHSHAVAMMSLNLPTDQFHATIETVAGWQTAGGTICLSNPMHSHSADTQCWSPVAPAHVIQDHWQNTIMALDGCSALHMFKQDMGPLLARDLRRAEGFIHVGLTDSTGDTDSFRVCLKLLCDERHGWLIVDPPPLVGERLVVLRRDQNLLPDQLTRMVELVRQNSQGNTILAAHYMACPSRHNWRAGARDRDHAILSDLLGDIPLIGALSNQMPVGAARLSFLTRDNSP